MGDILSFPAAPPAATPVSPDALTVKGMIDLFIEHHVSTLKDARPLRCLLKNYFPPLYEKTVESLTVLDVVAWSNAIRPHSNTQADACIKLLRSMVNKMIAWEKFDGANVAQRAKISGRRSRSTYIREQEMPRAMRAIMEAKYPERLYFTALLTMGPRPKELIHMQVQDIKLWKDDEGTLIGEWTKPAFRTKKNREHIIPITPPVAAMFATWLEVRPRGSDWMFPSRDPEKPLSKEGWHNRWDAIRLRAGIEHVWTYDLRRTAGTWCVDETGNLAAVSKGMLDHTNFKTTSVYVQVMDRTVRKVLTAHTQRLLDCAQPSVQKPTATSAPPEPVPVAPIPTATAEPMEHADETEWPG